MNDNKKTFIHTHFHSNYSTKDSICKIKYAIEKIKADGQTAMAITDHGTIGGTLDFYDECLAQGIKPIIGCEVYMRCERKLTTNPRENYHLILLCKNLIGWKNLIKIVKQSHDDSHYVPLVTWENLEQHHEGLIATTACFAGPVANPIIHDRYDIAEENLNRLIKLFGDDLYIEFQPNSIDNQVKINTALYELCKKYNLKYTIGVDAHYVDKDDAKSQETLLGINFKSVISDPPEHMASSEDGEEETTGKKRRTRFAFSKEDFWLSTEDDIYKMWDDNHKTMGIKDFGGAAPHILLLMQAFENMKEIENKVETFNIYPDKSLMTIKYDLLPEDLNSPEFKAFLERDKNNTDKITLKFLRYLLEKGYFELGLYKKPNAQEYLDRIRNVELPDTITAGITDYFLIVWDLVKHCFKEKILIGPGRGSVCGSLIAYLLGIHTVDPLEYGLIWERFYNAGRAGSMPDIDQDFQTTKRYMVLQYLLGRYGNDNVSAISNYAFYRPKSTFKAVCAYYELLYEDVNESIKGLKHLEIEDDPELLAELEKEFGIDFDDLQRQMVSLLESKKAQELLDSSPYKDMIIRDCLKIIGAVSNKSVHASGIVITSNPIITLCPTIKKKESTAKNGNIITQASEWDMKMLDRSGFLKLDILGLKTLDIIENTLKLANIPDFNWRQLQPDDPKVFNLFTIGNTTGVFQFDFGSELQRLCMDFKPKTFSDICALTALGRPGAKNFLEQYMINRSKSEQEIEILDKRLMPILKETNYVLAYQEQQMAICKVVSGFTLKEADDLRKIVAKKKVDKIAAMREKFIVGYVKTTLADSSLGITDEKQATDLGTKIWDAYFSDCGYLFNKSHAVVYSVLSYVTAYLKHYHTIPFMTAVLNNSNDGKREDFADYVYETMRMGIDVKRPHIRHSTVECTVNGESCIIGLNTIKDVSETNAEKLYIHNSSDESLINTLFNLPKKMYEAIILSGAADGVCGLNRRSLYQSAEFYKKIKDQWKDYQDKMKEFEKKVADMLEKGKQSKAKYPTKPAVELLKPFEFQKVIVDEFSLRELMAHEKEYLGYSPSDPDFQYLPFILNETLCKSKDKDLLKHRQICYIYGAIENVHVKQDKNKNDMATIEVKPKVSPYNFYITVFASSYDDKEVKEKLQINKSYVFKCEVNEYMSQKTQKLVKNFQFKAIREAKEVWANSQKR